MSPETESDAIMGRSKRHLSTARPGVTRGGRPRRYDRVATSTAERRDGPEAGVSPSVHHDTASRSGPCSLFVDRRWRASCSRGWSAVVQPVRRDYVRWSAVHDHRRGKRRRTCRAAEPQSAAYVADLRHAEDMVVPPPGVRSGRDQAHHRRAFIRAVPCLAQPLPYLAAVWWVAPADTLPRLPQPVDLRRIEPLALGVAGGGADIQGEAELGIESGVERVRGLPLVRRVLKVSGHPRAAPVGALSVGVRVVDAASRNRSCPRCFVTMPTLRNIRSRHSESLRPVVLRRHAPARLSSIDAEG